MATYAYIYERRMLLLNITRYIVLVLLLLVSAVVVGDCCRCRA